MVSELKLAGPEKGLRPTCTTRGAMGLANCPGLDAGERRADASLAGIGGCPSAPNASGNISTEDLAHILAVEGGREWTRGCAYPSRENGPTLWKRPCPHVLQAGKSLRRRISTSGSCDETPDHPGVDELAVGSGDGVSRITPRHVSSSEKVGQVATVPTESIKTQRIPPLFRSIPLAQVFFRVARRSIRLRVTVPKGSPAGGPCPGVARELAEGPASAPDHRVPRLAPRDVPPRNHCSFSTTF